MEEYFDRIENLTFDPNYYTVFNINNSESFFFGKNIEDKLIFLIKPNKGITNNFNYPPSYRGKSLDIDFNITCEFPIKKSVIKDDYTLLTLKTESKLMTKMFIALCIDLIEFIGENPDHIKVVSIVESLRGLFSSVYKKGTHDEIGLWGELFVISQDQDIEKAIDSWHLNPSDTFDFNDGHLKMEVKTTTQEKRVHAISLNQILKSIESESLICSIMTSEIELGKDLNDLKRSIDLRINMTYRNKLVEKIFKSVGDNWGSFNSRYDYATAVNSLKYFDAVNIPKIDPLNIEPEITNVKFSVNLENTVNRDISLLQNNCGYLPN